MPFPSTLDPGALTRCYKGTCAVGRRTQTAETHNVESEAEPKLWDLGWKETTRLAEDDSCDWICPKYPVKGSYRVYRDKDAEDLWPEDVPGLR